MAYRIHPDEGLEDGLQRIASEQLAAALRDLEDDDADPHGVVHEVRKRCEKLRGPIRLFRPALALYDEGNASVENLPGWRKRVKDHRPPLSMLRGGGSPVLRPIRDAAKALTGRLGDDHDLALLRETVLEDGGARALLGEEPASDGGRAPGAAT